MHSAALLVPLLFASTTVLAQIYFPPDPEPPRAGKLSDADIREVVSSHEDDVAQCVEDHRRRDPATSGKLVLRWIIDTSGRTSSVGIVSAEHARTPFAMCMAGTVRDWTFPRHTLASPAVEFPFAF